MRNRNMATLLAVFSIIITAGMVETRGAMNFDGPKIEQDSSAGLAEVKVLSEFDKAKLTLELSGIDKPLSGAYEAKVLLTFYRLDNSKITSEERVFNLLPSQDDKDNDGIFTKALTVDFTPNMLPGDYKQLTVSVVVTKVTDTGLATWGNPVAIMDRDIVNGDIGIVAITLAKK